MHRRLCKPILLLAFAAAPLASQSLVAINPQQCVWHQGDNPAWAAPNLDQSGWQPLQQWKLPDRPHFWVRCQVDLSSLHGAAHPEIAVYHNTAYQAYLDGALVGANGSPASGFSYILGWKTIPVDGSRFAAGHVSTIAIRSYLRYVHPGATNPGLQILAGGELPLREHLAALSFSSEANWIGTAIGFGIIGLAGFCFLGLYCFDRSHPALLILPFLCWGLSCERILQTLDAMHILIWTSVYWSLYFASLIGTHLTAVFAYRLNGRRVPWFYKIVTSYMIFYFMAILCSLLLPLDAAYSYNRIWLFVSSHYLLFGTSPALSIGLIAAFLPWRTVARPMRPLAICCFLWSTADLIYLLPQTVRQFSPPAFALFLRVAPRLLEVRGTCIITAIVALAWLLFRDQQRTAKERAELAGEMHAAGEIQRMLAPAAFESAPGLRIDVAFHPMREVGGDFYLCRVLFDGRQRVLIGDVSGKGAAAAMAATLLLGAAAARDSDSPAALLTHLNRVLIENHLGGFATCLCADIASGGDAAIANAGHLPPYRNGREIEIPSGLPLGVEPGTEYAETTLRLEPGASLTLLSDGVAEARNSFGELFGFDRTRALSTESAQKIARAANAFGQEDDITVLTITFAPVEVAHA